MVNSLKLFPVILLLVSYSVDNNNIPRNDLAQN